METLKQAKQQEMQVQVFPMHRKGQWYKRDHVLMSTQVQLRTGKRTKNQI